MSKLLLLTLNGREEKVIDKIIAAISDYIQLEPVQITPASVLSFPGLEIRQSGDGGYFKTGRKSTLPALNTVPSYSLLPIPALSLHKNRYLNPFGTWIVIAAIQALST